MPHKSVVGEWEGFDRRADSWDSCQLPHSRTVDLLWNNYILFTLLPARFDQAYQLIKIAGFRCFANAPNHQRLSPAAQILTYGHGQSLSDSWQEGVGSAEKQNPITPSRFHSIVQLPLIHLIKILWPAVEPSAKLARCLNTIWHVRKCLKILSQGGA